MEKSLATEGLGSLSLLWVQILIIANDKSLALSLLLNAILILDLGNHPLLLLLLILSRGLRSLSYLLSASSRPHIIGSSSCVLGAISLLLIDHKLTLSQLLSSRSLGLQFLLQSLSLLGVSSIGLSLVILTAWLLLGFV